ncbi:hypothetical protein [Pedobacter sp.]|uniref:hypothetical protein n=1 Tax=Pedobacter sp. TaxID=1411316 RepID=UPI003BA9052A
MNSLSNFFLGYLLLTIVAITILSIVEEVYYFKAFGIEIINLVGIESLIFSGRGISLVENLSAILLCPTFICLILILQEWLKDSLNPNFYRRWIFSIVALPFVLMIPILLFSGRTIALGILIAHLTLLIISYFIIFHLRLYIAQTLGIHIFLVSFILLSILATLRIDRTVNYSRSQKSSFQDDERGNTNNQSRKLIHVGTKEEYNLYFDPRLKIGVVKKKR